MKLKCVIEVPDNDYRTKLDAMAKAGRDESLWTYVSTKEELKKKTTLDNKCGSCIHYHPFDALEGLPTCGSCDAGRVWGQRTRPKCKKYERKAE